MHDTALSSAHFPKSVSQLAQTLETFQMSIKHLYLGLWVRLVKAKIYPTAVLTIAHSEPFGRSLLSKCTFLGLVWIEFHLDCRLDTGALLVVSDRATGTFWGKKQLARDSLLGFFFLWHSQDEKTLHLMFPLFGNDTRQPFPRAKQAV